MKKVLGWVLMAIGAIALLSSLSATKSFIPIKIPDGISTNIILIAGAVLLIIGALLGLKSADNKKQSKEVPIYHGKEIVGYRRV